jgi:pilus assembly protein CpaE
MKVNISMSEAGQQDTSILLPESRVAVYARDADTLDALRALSSDWRYARVGVEAVDGDVDSAIAAYVEASSPELIIIQTDTINDAFTAQLEALAGNCDEGTSAIIIGPENDVNLYRRLIDMGVSDYLVRPITTPVISEVIAKALIEKIGVTGSRLIAVIGAKGGVGASILSQGLACGVADVLKQNTTLLDASGGCSTLGVGLGFEPSTTLAEAARAVEQNNEENLKRMLHPINDRLQVLATGSDVMLDSTVSAAQLEVLVDTLMMKSPVVVVDLSNSPDILQKIVLTRANQIFVVTTPTLPALRLTRSLMQEIDEVRGGEESPVSKLVLNMHGLSKAYEVSTKDIEEAVGHKIDASLPFLPKAFLGSESTSQRLIDDKEGRELIESQLLPIVRKVLPIHAKEDNTPEKTGFLDSILGAFKK